MGQFCWSGCRGGQAGVLGGGYVGVDDRAGAVLAGVQALRPVETDDHLTIRLPPLLLKVFLQVLGEGLGGEIAICAQLLEVGHTEGNDVLVRNQGPSARERLNAVGGLPSQQGLQFLRDHRTPEDSREGIPHAVLQHAFDALNQPLLVIHRRAPTSSSRRLTAGCSWYRLGSSDQQQANSENRITAGQPSLPGLESEPSIVIGSPGRFGRVAEWQTRWLQVPVSFGTWGFKSPFAHSFMYCEH